MPLRRLRTVFLVLFFLVAMTFGAVASAALSSKLESGYGALLSAWVHQHPPDTRGCAIGSCYGPIVQSATAEPQFSFVQTFRGHVVGYDEALPRGTSLLQAELEVARQFPADATSSRVTVVRHDRFGHSCAVYDLWSRALNREFGRKGPARQGQSIGVELATVLPNGATKYDPASIDIAIISPLYVDDSTNC